MVPTPPVKRLSRKNFLKPASRDKVIFSDLLTRINTQLELIVSGFIFHVEQIVTCKSLGFVKIFQIHTKSVDSLICQAMDLVQTQLKLSIHESKSFLIIIPAPVEIYYSI